MYCFNKNFIYIKSPYDINHIKDTLEKLGVNNYIINKDNLPMIHRTL